LLQLTVLKIIDSPHQIPDQTTARHDSKRAVNAFPNSRGDGDAVIIAPGLIDQAEFVTGCRESIMGGAQPAEI